MKVWVLESGCYEQRCVAGIYTSAEIAMACCNKRWKWIYDKKLNIWTNNQDWDDFCELSEHEIIESVTVK